jgi:hypothetical protein
MHCGTGCPYVEALQDDALGATQRRDKAPMAVDDDEAEGVARVHHVLQLLRVEAIVAVVHGRTNRPRRLDYHPPWLRGAVGINSAAADEEQQAARRDPRVVAQLRHS